MMAQYMCACERLCCIPPMPLASSVNARELSNANWANTYSSQPTHMCFSSDASAVRRRVFGFHVHQRELGGNLVGVEVGSGVFYPTSNPNPLDGRNATSPHGSRANILSVGLP